MNSQSALPSYTLYRRNCHSSQSNYFCYLSSTTEFKIVQFNQDNKIKNTICVTIPLQPVKAILLQIHQSKIYTAVALLTRIIVYEGKQVFYQSTLQLDANIAFFRNGYAAIDRYEGEGEKGFAFVTKNGIVSFFDINKKSRTVKFPSGNFDRRIQSMAVNYPHIFLGTQDGNIIRCKISQNQQRYAKQNTYDTTSKLPILNIALTNLRNNNQKQVICTSCQGEIYLLSNDLKFSSVVSAHQCLISRLMVNQNKLYTVGEDLILNKFEILGNRKIKLIQSQSFTNLVSLLFTINKKPYISFYQTPIIRPI